jgi:hypothetical protein
VRKKPPVLRMASPAFAPQNAMTLFAPNSPSKRNNAQISYCAIWG